MDLSRQLLKQFADITNITAPKGESTVYATVMEVEDSIGAGGLLTGKVQIDGSTERTPVTSTVKITTGNRVIVRLKDHTATVISNVNDPSASDKDVTNVTSRLKNAEGDISEIKQTAEGITNRVEDAEGNITLLYQAAEEIVQSVEDMEGDVSKLEIAAEGIVSRVEDVEGSVTEVQQTAEDIRQSVKNLEGEMSEFSQEAGKVSVKLTSTQGTLETYITQSQWEALYTSLSTGKVESGFYFDFALGRFVYDGTGIYRSDDGSAYIQIENDGIAVYAEDGTGSVDRKLHIGFNSSGNVAYPYVLMGAPENVGEAGIIKKFSNGLFIGNGHAVNASGDFAPTANYTGIFVNTEEGVTYVVNGSNMQNVYTGAAIAKFK